MRARSLWQSESMAGALRYGIFLSLPIRSDAKAITAQGYLPRRDLACLDIRLRTLIHSFEERSLCGALEKLDLALAFRSQIVRSFIFEQSCRPKSMKTPKVDEVKARRCAIRIRLKDQWRNTASSLQKYLMYSLDSINSGREIFQNKHSTPSKVF
jgi:hypothetical protein